MVTPVSDPGLLANIAPAARPASARADVENTTSETISTTLRRVVALTAKFGPDPVTGSPLQIIAGEDVEAAETNDLQRLAQANLGLSSPENAFQAQSVRSEAELAAETEASASAQAAQQSLAANTSSSTQNGGGGIPEVGQRGLSVDIQV